MFNWAIEQDIVDSNPCTGVSEPTKPRQRDRVLSQDEIVTFWYGLDRDEVRE
jgi:site-specific recombinase XerC